MANINKFGVILFKKESRAKEALERLTRWADANDVELLIHPKTPKEVVPTGVKCCKSESQLIDNAQVVVSIGGDGTFLSSAHIVNFSEVPIVGINLGRVGFLADIEYTEFESCLTKIKSGEYSTISRMVLDIRVIRNGRTVSKLNALNDLYINRSSIPRLVSVSMWYGDDKITDYVADGVVISTPSGSTAYSLAAGGPIVPPGLESFVVTPICPHSISERPIVLGAQRAIRLKINAKNPSPLMSVDGLDSIQLEPDDEVIVEFIGKSTNLIQFSQHSYFDTLRQKLNWSNISN